MAEIRRQWFRGPIGYRDAQLESADLTAAMTLFVAGVPAVMVGADLVAQGAGLGQLVLSVPLGCLLGALLVGLVGRQAAGSGVPSAYLGRAGFGSLGGVLYGVVRLALTLAWTAVLLRVAAGWVTTALASFEVSVPLRPVIAVLGLLSVLLFLPGPAWVVSRLLRRRLFWLGVVMLGVAAWRILAEPGPATTVAGSGGFVEAIDAVIGLSLLWSVVGGDIGGYGHREQETASGLGYGFAVASLLLVMAGATLATRVEGFPIDVAVFGTGTAGALLLLLWVPAMEVDGAGGLNVAGSGALETIVPFVPPRLLMILAAAASAAGAIVIPLETLREAAELALTLFAPAVGVVLADAYLVRGGAYSADELFRWRGDYGLANPVGLGSWIGGAAMGVWLRPATTELGAGWMPTWAGSGPDGLPALLIGLVVGALLHFAVGQLIFGRSGRTYHMRGV